MNISTLTEYQQLREHQSLIKKHSLRRLFEEAPARAQQFSLTLESLYFDFSKNHITGETLQLLMAFANRRRLQPAIADLFNGEQVNHTENRPALHHLLRQPDNAQKNRQQMARLVNQVHEKQRKGFSGKAIDTIVSIGIGGSDLGPRMAVNALSAYKTQDIDIHFVANIDGADLCDTLAQVRPETTLFIIASKSFGTLETRENAQTVRRWLTTHHCPETKLHQHFVATTTNISAACDFGIAKENIFTLSPGIGGRFSLWSAIGLPIALSIGMESFTQLLQGAHLMDKHYANTPLTQNIPAISALLSFWYSQFWQVNASAILPYAQRLQHFPAYLQQLEMESLGKATANSGQAINYPTGNIIWGAQGSNGQHSFHQLLHQGSTLIPAEFIAIKAPMSDLSEQHQHLLANCIAQSQALLKGKTLADAKAELLAQGVSTEQANLLAPHKVVAGNKPSSTLVLASLTPKTLGMLIALYEHRVHALGVLLDLNPFDQWGVEIGKQLSQPIFQALGKGAIDNRWDSSTQTLIDQLKN